MKSARYLFAFAVAVGSAVGTAMAADLKIATAQVPTSADPHFFLFVANDELRRYAFESLIQVDKSGTPIPQLAESWRLLSDTKWEFKLRQNVAFHDGSTFDANDVVYSICRIRANETAGSFARYVAQVKTVEIPDPNTLIIETDTPYPLLLPEFSLWAVVSAPADAQGLDITKKGCGLDSYQSNADFDNGRAAIGTGPYKLQKFERGSASRFRRFDGYWGEKPAWENVTVTPVENAAARTAALLAGDYDLIQAPTPQGVARLEGNANYTLARSPTYDVRYLMFDQSAEPSPQVKGTGGKNPFKDIRVREAISKAINRPAIVKQLLDGNGVIATNVQGPETFGYNPDLKSVAYDPEAARRLLAEAGYPNGFEVPLNVTTDAEASRVGQALAQMLTQVGIKTTVESAPNSVFFGRRAKYDFSLYSYTVGTRTGEMLTAVRVLLGTPGFKPSFGGINGARYSNPKLDELLLQAQTSMDTELRRKLLQEANAVASEDYAFVPLYQRVDLWAFRSKLRYTPRVDGYTLAQDVAPAN